MKRYLFCKLLLLNYIFLFSQTSDDNTVQITTSYTSSPAEISFTWDAFYDATDIVIYRKDKESTNWGTAIATLDGTATSFSDASVTEGIEYEYRINKNGGPTANTYILSGINIPEIDERGKIILLVDSTFVNILSSDLKFLESDLIGDGWKVIRKDINRNTSVAYVKSVISNYYQSDPVNVKAVFLFGHIPVPYSGNLAPDGHSDHVGAWSADVYYADMDESGWTDITVNTTSAIRVANQNIPGDGKFDQNAIPSDVELELGRVDMYDLSFFSETEEELLRRYLKKNHDYRTRAITAPKRAMIDDRFGYMGGEAFASSGWRAFAATLGAEYTANGDYTNLQTDKYLWSYGCGAGMGYIECRDVVKTVDFAANPYYSVFTILFGSYFGDWDSPNNLLRASLASEGWILTNFWSGRPYCTFHQMGMGENIGYCIKKSQNNNTNSPYVSNGYAGYIHTALIGDPSLRMHMLAPSPALSGVKCSSNIELYWVESPDSVIGYNVYRLDTVAFEYIKLTPSPISTNTFIDNSPTVGKNYYMVRALALEKSACGSYYNLSQGTFDTVSSGSCLIPVADIAITSSSGNSINTDKDTVQLIAEILPANASIDIVQWSIENQTGNATVDVNGQIIAISDGTVIVTASAIDGSGVFGTFEINISNQINLVEDIEITTENGDTSINTYHGTLQLYANVIPEYANNTSVTWNVYSNPGKASITPDGLLTAEEEGSVIVIAISQDGTDIVRVIEILIGEQIPSFINDNEVDDVIVYPVPASDVINIEIQKFTSEYKYEICNLQGQILNKNNINEKNAQIDISELSAGMYVVKIASNDKSYKKVIVKK